MKWNLEFAPHLKFYQQLQSQGRPTPLDKVPKIGLIGEWYLEAFRILANGRQEMSQLSLQELFSYMDHFGCVGSKEEFIEVIQEMDRVYLEHFYKKQEQKHARHNRRPNKH